MTMRRLWMATALAAVALSAWGQGDRIITNARMVGVGSHRLLDTYLSPENYSGWQVQLLSHTLRSRDSMRHYREIIHHGSLSTLDNRSGNGGEITGFYNFQYGWHWQWVKTAVGGGTLTVGGGVNVDAVLGFVYNTRNSNNPAQAKASVAVAPTAEASYRWHIKGHPFLLRYEVGVPVAGLTFSPNYGQSYYEIFTQGNYDHNVAPTWVGNAPSLWQMATLDVPIRRTTLRIGYWGNYRQTEVNQLKFHTYSHAVMIGIVRTFSIHKHAHP